MCVCACVCVWGGGGGGSGGILVSGCVGGLVDVRMCGHLYGTIG